MGGALAGRNTQTTSVPAWLEQAGQRALAQGERASQIGYVPYSGPQVAAFTPMQNAAFAGTNQAASAFGMPTSQGNGMPAPQTFAGGVQGYSSMPLYNQAMADLQQNRPGQYAAINNMFVNPQSGSAMQPQAQPQQIAPQVQVQPQTQQSGGRSDNRNTGPSRNQGSVNMGGYTGLRDMVNGGGPGAAGTGLLGRILGAGTAQPSNSASGNGGRRGSDGLTNHQRGNIFDRGRR